MRRLHLLVAWRYFFSRKQKSIINIISWISLVGLAVSTAALIIVMSVYNGIGQLTQGLFNSFDPTLLVQPTKGKTFHASTIDLQRLQQVEDVVAVSQMVEENAWITCHQSQAIVQLRGVDGAYAQVSGLDTLMYEGEYQLSLRTTTVIAGDSSTVTQYFLLMGAEVYYNLGISTENPSPVALHIPRRGIALGMTMDEAFNTRYALPAGNFYIQQDIDNRYVVTDIALVRQLMDYSPDECTALAIALDGNANMAKVKKQVRSLLGGQYTVKDRYEQQPIYYKVFKSERLGIYLILALIVAIASLNLMASLSLLVLDKRDDIATWRSLGMPVKDIRRTFRLEGLMIAGVGVAVGLAVGFAVCLIQQRYGVVKMGNNFVVEAFPVAMQASDFLITLLLVTTISLCAVMLATRQIKN